MSSPYLKSASVDKDESGDYWLHVYSGEGHAVFCLNDCLDLNAEENAGVRRTLETWLADQDSRNRLP